MPISPIVLQRRHAELGRIRLGDQQPTSGGRTRPNKLSAFRFTSVSERYIRDLAELYGGEPRAWDNAGVASWEVYTTATSIPVIAVKGGLSQWMETWSGGGCVHRCDGEHNTLTDSACDPDDRAHRDAKPTTRLSVMLPELEAIGVWRMESHGWNAAAEIPAVAELAQFVGDLVPAHLNLVERRSVKDGKTSRFVVPVLDLQIGTAKLREIVAAKSGAPLELETAGRPALGAGASESTATSEDLSPYSAYFAKLGQAKTLDDLTAIWNEARDAGLVGSHLELVGPHAAFVDAFKVEAHKLKQTDQQPAPAAEPDAEGVVDAELVPDADADGLWQQILATAGLQGMTEADLQDDFAARMGGVSSGEATAAELQHYLGLLTAGAAA